MAASPISLINGLINSKPSVDNSIINSGSVSPDANAKALMSLLDSLSNGETIAGKVMSSKDGMLQLLTGDNVMINAELAEGVSLTEGTTALFEVSKGSDNRVSLRPLYQNTASTQTASAALRQAGLPENTRTMEMVVRNMEYGNPIDRNSLIRAYRDVALYPDVPVKYITDLQKMGIPASGANFEQYEAYLNMENSVSEAFNDIGESIFTELENALLAYDTGTETDPSGVRHNMQTPDNLSEHMAGERVSLQNADPKQLSAEASEAFTLKDNSRLPDGVPVNAGMPVSAETKAGIIMDSFVSFAESLDETAGFDMSVTRADVEKLISDMNNITDNAGLRELVATERDSFTPVTVFKAVMKDLQTKISGRIDTEADGIQGQEGISVPERSTSGLPESFKVLLTRTLSSQWSLSKDEIADKGEVRALYDRLFEQSAKLLGTLSESAGKDSPVTKTVQNLSDNLQFMNSLNNYVPYVQIPFRSESGNTGSELYVYKNKRSLAAGDSEVSAFIHLDMEHLGPTDVLVKLKDAGVTTKFTLADDAALDIINDNIDFLNKRLNDKGYSFKAEMVRLDREEAPISTMLINTTDRLMVSRTSFDARI